MLIMMVTTLIAMLVLYLRGRGGGFGGGAGSSRPAETGSLRVTGVSPCPDADGEQYVTITGELSGPSVPATVVYGRFAWDVRRWPAIGDDIPVVYPVGKPDRWRIAHPGARPGLGS